MLQVTQAAATVLEQARDRMGNDSSVGFRFKRSEQAAGDGSIGIGLVFVEKAEAGDQMVEQQDLQQRDIKLWVSSDLVEPLSGRTLDAEATDAGARLIFR